MAKQRPKKSSEEDDRRWAANLIEECKPIFALLKEWASSGLPIVCSTGGLSIEGTVTMLRDAAGADALEMLDAVFVFTAKALGVKAFIYMGPQMKLSATAGTTYLELQDKCRFHAKKSAAGPDPETLQKALSQLKAWSICGAKVWVYMEFPFSAVGSLCQIETVNDRSFALSSSESADQQTFIAHPTLSPRVAVEQLEGVTLVKLASEDNALEMCIFEAIGGQEGLKSRMASRMIH